MAHLKKIIFDFFYGQNCLTLTARKPSLKSYKICTGFSSVVLTSNVKKKKQAKHVLRSKKAKKKLLKLKLLLEKKHEAHWKSLQ